MFEGEWVHEGRCPTLPSTNPNGWKDATLSIRMRGWLFNCSHCLISVLVEVIFLCPAQCFKGWKDTHPTEGAGWCSLFALCFLIPKCNIHITELFPCMYSSGPSVYLASNLLLTSSTCLHKLQSHNIQIIPICSTSYIAPCYTFSSYINSSFFQHLSYPELHYTIVGVHGYFLRAYAVIPGYASNPDLHLTMIRPDCLSLF